VKKIYFLRHAKSDWTLFYNSSDVSDFDRPLSKKGILNAKKIKEYIRREKILIDFVACSSSKRTFETFLIIKPSLKNIKLLKCDELYTFNETKLIKQIYKFSNKFENILIIGHNPAIHDTVLNLTNKNINENKINLINEKFPTSCLAIVEFKIKEWKQLEGNSGTLKEVIFSKELF